MKVLSHLKTEKLSGVIPSYLELIHDIILYILLLFYHSKKMIFPQNLIVL